MILDVWTFLWLLLCFTILISILESIYRRLRERRRLLQQLDAEERIHAQQYHVYTLHPLATPMQRNSVGSGVILSQQQQEYIHQQQELKAANDLPPKYEDVVDNPYNFAILSSSRHNSIDIPPRSDSVNVTQPTRY